MTEVTSTVPTLNIEGLFSILYNILFRTIPGLEPFLTSFWYVYSILAFLISALLLFGLVYAKIRYTQLAEIEQETLRQAEASYTKQHGESSKNTRWQDALKHADSDNPNDWRLAIIEADIILEEMLDTLGYPGSTIGDRLKQASPETFRTIDDAWKAHKIRNDIAHRGTDFILTKRMAREALERYQRVFEEFSIV